MQFTTYILFSQQLDKYYIGYSEDINKRLVQHNAGLSTFTSSANDWQLVYKETYATRQEARARELAIKKKKSRKYIEWLIASAG